MATIAFFNGNALVVVRNFATISATPGHLNLMRRGVRDALRGAWSAAREAQNDEAGHEAGVRDRIPGAGALRRLNRHCEVAKRMSPDSLSVVTTRTRLTWAFSEVRRQVAS